MVGFDFGGATLTLLIRPKTSLELSSSAADMRENCSFCCRANVNQTENRKQGIIEAKCST